ncbi:MAG TPA: phage major capsid protein [Candidatus Binatia bacterium]|nr:phage major capsid protein [Candidatus Binatia bacterium]
MPNVSDYSKEDDWMGACVPAMVGEGREQEQAVAACMSMWRERKSFDGMTIEEAVAHFLKVGARHTRKEMESFQTVHDIMVENGAMCKKTNGKSEPVEELIAFGDSIKAVKLDDGSVKFTGYLVRFGDEKHTDLTGDFFTKDTDFGDATESDVYFNHRLPIEIDGVKIEYKGRMGRAKLVKDDIGVFAETILKARNAYEKAIIDAGLADALGWSSGTAGHLVDRTPVGKAQRIDQWILGVDSSTTPTPAEPRNRVIPLKSLNTSASGMTETDDQKPIEELITKESDMNETELKTLLADNNKAIIESMTATIKETVKAEVEPAAKKAVDDVLDKLPEVKARLGAVQVTHDPADVPFKSIAANMIAIRANTVTHGNADNDYPRLRFLKATGASEGVPQDGGILLDPTLSGEVLKPLHEEGPFSKDIRFLPVGGNSNYGWINGVDETSRVAGSRWGGIRGYRVAEAATKTASKPAFRRINWELKEYAAVVVATDPLLADASQFSEIVKTGVAEELMFMLNEDIFDGLGTAGPLGIQQSGAMITVTRTDANKILGQDISNMWVRMDLRGRKSAKWYISNDAGPQLDNLFAVGSTAVLYPYASIGPDGVKRLYGRPIETTEFNETLGTAGDIVLADMTQYLGWQKGEIEQSTSIHVYFLSDETAFRFVYRVDGKPTVNTALTPLKGSTTTSPFVRLLATS